MASVLQPVARRLVEEPRSVSQTRGNGESVREVTGEKFWSDKGYGSKTREEGDRVGKEGVRAAWKGAR